MGDDDSDVVYTNSQPCALADDGFGDEEMAVRFTDRASQQGVGLGPQKVYWVWEIRSSSTGAGRRMADMGWIGGDLYYTTHPIAVKLIRELEGVSLYTWVGSCPTGLDLQACVNHAIATSFHDEPHLCIWNPAVGAAGGRDAWCGTTASHNLHTTNVLPVAGAIHIDDGGCLLFVARIGPDGSIYEECGLVLATRAYALGYMDPDGESVSFDWFINDLLQPQRTPDVTVGGTTFICTLRLAVRDPRGGMDTAGSLVVGCL